jgi:hypothetical protein
MREINFEFEELPLGSFKTADGLVCQFEACAWGRAVIAYDANAWTVQHIQIDASAKVDGRWVTRGAPLDRHHPLWKLIADALRERQADQIEARRSSPRRARARPRDVVRRVSVFRRRHCGAWVCRVRI